MLIQIDKLKRQPRQIEIDEAVSYFPVLQELTKNGALSFDKNIKGSLQANWAGDAIDVRGQLVTQISAPCARCLAPVPSVLEVDVLLCYSSKSTEVAEDSEDVEIKSDELGLIPYSGNDIDLRPDVEQEIIMSVPQQFLCSDSCKGLCPICGDNQNIKQCVCEKPVFHEGLAALKNLKIKP